MRNVILACLAVALAAGLLVCKDPLSFQPGDPSMPDPPGPPVPVYPPDGENTGDYGYPQDVAFQWGKVNGAIFYQVEVYTESIPELPNLHTIADGVTTTTVTVRFGRYGFYYWRVRAGSHRWNWYTDWSELNRFVLPNPAR